MIRSIPWKAVLGFQSSYYMLSGAWPLVHMKSFVWVTGPKDDVWLVKMVGALTLVIGVTLLASSRQPRFTAPAFVLAFFSALAYMTEEIIYFFYDILSPVYLLDAILEIFLMLFIFRAFTLEKGNDAAI